MYGTTNVRKKDRGFSRTRELNCVLLFSQQYLSMFIYTQVTSDVSIIDININSYILLLSMGSMQYVNAQGSLRTQSASILQLQQQFHLTSDTEKKWTWFSQADEIRGEARSSEFNRTVFGACHYVTTVSSKAHAELVICESDHISGSKVSLTCHRCSTTSNIIAITWSSSKLSHFCVFQRLLHWKKLCEERQKPSPSDHVSVRTLKTEKL